MLHAIEKLEIERMECKTEKSDSFGRAQSFSYCDNLAGILISTFSERLDLICQVG